MDHYFQMEFNGGAEDPMLEAYTTLGYLAGHTSTVQLGALVTGVTYRHPGLLAKIATTLDVLSGGRATLGIGAAWYDREHEGLGVPFPPVAERFERLEETLRICLQMWDPEANGSFEGKHYRLAETLCVPAPVSSPHPEIMIGGGGEKKTLRLVAHYADACNISAKPDIAAHKLDVLRRHCDTVGRRCQPAAVDVEMLADVGFDGTQHRGAARADGARVAQQRQRMARRRTRGLHFTQDFALAPAPARRPSARCRR